MTKLLISHIQKVIEYNVGYGSGYEIHLKKRIFEKFKRFEGDVYLIPKWNDNPVSIHGITSNKLTKKSYVRTSKSLLSKKAASFSIKKIKFSETRDKARYKLMT